MHGKLGAAFSAIDANTVRTSGDTAYGARLVGLEFLAALRAGASDPLMSGDVEEVNKKLAFGRWRALGEARERRQGVSVSHSRISVRGQA